MENTDARVLLQHIYNTYGYQISKNFKDNAIRDAFELADKALEKQIPKKPIVKQYFKDMEEKYLCCPTCGEILTDRIPGDNKTFYFHCMNCGQKFDWSDEE